MEQVAEATKKPFWFQVYVIRDRGFIADLIARAKAANCSALVLTVDLQVLGQRHRDIKNGMTVPPKIKLANVIDIADRSRAGRWSMLNAKSKTFGNLAGHVKGMEGVNSLAQWTNSQFDPTLSWQDVEWIRSLWPGKLIIKGILDVEDAKLATKSGADAIVVSNHGGRQLDGAPSSISMLPKIADAVGNDIEVMFDGGIRSGPGPVARDRARRQKLPDRQRLHLRARRARQAGRHDGDRHHPQGARHHHGADRRHPDLRHRPQCAGDRDGAGRSPMCWRWRSARQRCGR